MVNRPTNYKSGKLIKEDIWDLFVYIDIYMLWLHNISITKWKAYKKGYLRLACSLYYIKTGFKLKNQWWGSHIAYWLHRLIAKWGLMTPRLSCR